MAKLRRGLEVARSRCYLDLGGATDTLILAGVARSGTTWLGGILQNACRARSIFEPLFPRYVKASRPFGYYPYRAPGEADLDLAGYLQRITEGRIRCRWVDRDNRSLIYRRRIIKEIRWNFILPWYHENFPRVPIILMVRNPLAVYASWLKLDWIENTQNASQVFALPHLLSNRSFCQRYPHWYELMRKVEKEPFLSFILQWYLSYAVPLEEMPKSSYFLVSYDELLADDDVLESVAGYAGAILDRDKLLKLSASPSSTDFGNRSRRPGTSEKIKGELMKTGLWDTADEMLQKLCGSGLEAMCANPRATISNSLYSINSIEQPLA